MMLLRPRPSLLRTAAALMMAGALVLSTGCGSDDDEGDRASSSDKTETTPTTPTTGSGGVSAPLNFGVTAYDPATGVLTGSVIDSTETEPEGSGPLIVDAQTEIVVQGAERPEKLPLGELDQWIRQRLTDLGDTASAVTMEISYQSVDDQRKVITLTEVPPG